MTKSQLVDQIAEKADISKKVADAALSALTDVVVETVAGGDKVQIVGFGSFEPRDRAARTGVNPQTGDRVEIPACKTPHFTPGKAFKEAVKR